MLQTVYVNLVFKSKIFAQYLNTKGIHARESRIEQFQNKMATNSALTNRLKEKESYKLVEIWLREIGQSSPFEIIAMMVDYCLSDTIILKQNQKMLEFEWRIREDILGPYLLKHMCQHEICSEIIEHTLTQTKWCLTFNPYNFPKSPFGHV